MSGCETPIRWSGVISSKPMTPERRARIDAIKAEMVEAERLLAKQCDCDHGEDDPCCSETETPEEDVE